MPTKRERGAMKILKVENGCGYFLMPGQSEWKAIDKIDKEELLGLLDAFLENEVELDEPDESALTNQAHLIIYRSIFEKLNTLADNKSKFRDESERMYLDEIRKYSQS